MAVCYVKLWKLLIDKKMKRTDLISLANISNSTLAKMGKNKYVSLEVLDRICNALDCNIENVVEILPDEE